MGFGISEVSEKIRRLGHDAPGKQTFASLDNAVKLKGVQFLI